jgi:SnoaL-like domain
MPQTFEGLTASEAKNFAAQWLPAWTGNDPDLLASFYAEDCFYSDPAVAEGIEGRDALTRYFTALLPNFPNWKWTNTGVTPIPGGFLNHWHASIPVSSTTIECDGVCTVVLRDGLIARNEVFFDRSELLAAIAEAEVGVE